MAEEDFQRWYKGWAGKLGIDPNPDHPAHKYDYRAAYAAGKAPTFNTDYVSETDSGWHWPSEFKADDHPNRFVDGIDTITGQKAGDKTMPYQNATGPMVELEDLLRALGVPSQGMHSALEPQPYVQQPRPQPAMIGPQNVMGRMTGIEDLIRVAGMANQGQSPPSPMAPVRQQPPDVQGRSFEAMPSAEDSALDRLGIGFGTGESPPDVQGRSFEAMPSAEDSALDRLGIGFGTGESPPVPLIAHTPMPPMPLTQPPVPNPPVRGGFADAPRRVTEEEFMDEMARRGVPYEEARWQLTLKQSEMEGRQQDTAQQQGLAAWQEALGRARTSMAQPGGDQAQPAAAPPQPAPVPPPIDPAMAFASAFKAGVDRGNYPGSLDEYTQARIGLGQDVKGGLTGDALTERDLAIGAYNPGQTVDGKPGVQQTLAQADQAFRTRRNTQREAGLRPSVKETYDARQQHLADRLENRRRRDLNPNLRAQEVMDEENARQERQFETQVAAEKQVALGGVLAAIAGMEGMTQGTMDQVVPTIAKAMGVPVPGGEVNDGPDEVGTSQEHYQRVVGQVAAQDQERFTRAVNDGDVEQVAEILRANGVPRKEAELLLRSMKPLEENPIGLFSGQTATTPSLEHPSGRKPAPGLSLPSEMRIGGHVARDRRLQEEAQGLRPPRKEGKSFVEERYGSRRPFG